MFFLTSEQVMTLTLAIIVVSVPDFRRIYFSSVNFYQEKSIKRRLVFFDMVKGIAILSVILIHTLLLFKLSHKGSEKFIDIVNNTVRFAVPVFLICTGILLNPRHVESKRGIVKFYIKKIITILIPYFIATLIISLYSKSSIGDFFHYIVTGKAQGPYYYILVLTQLYIVYPILIKLKHKRWFLAGSFFISISFYFWEFAWHLYGITLFMPYLYFFSYGLANRDYFLNTLSKKNNQLLFILIVVGYLIFTFIWTDYFYNTLYVYGVAIWSLLFIYQDKLISALFAKGIANIGKVSLWVYLIHFPIILILFRLFTVIQNTSVQIILIYIISIAISYSIATWIHMLYSGFWYKYVSKTINI